MSEEKVWHEDDAFWHTFAPGMFTPETWEAVPEQVDQMLTLLEVGPGGRLLIDIMGKEMLARIFLPRNWDERDGVLYLQERKVTDDWSWIENRWIAIDGTRRHETQVSHRVYSAVELKRLLAECGFGEVRVFGDLDGSDYDHKARRLVALATKPDEGGSTQ